MECAILCFSFFFFPSQCVKHGCGLGTSLFSLRIQGLASYQHELLRGKKIIRISMLNTTLEEWQWWKGRDCYFHCCTLWQSFGLLHSKSWELVSRKSILYSYICLSLSLSLYVYIHNHLHHTLISYFIMSDPMILSHCLMRLTMHWICHSKEGKEKSFLFRYHNARYHTCKIIQRLAFITRVRLSWCR